MPSNSIVAIREVRTCKEHMCRVLRQKMLWTRCFFGLLTFDVAKTQRLSTEPDHNGLVAVSHVNIYLRKRFGKPGDPDHEVLQAYCGLTADGRITGSGLMDPKDIVFGSINYCQLSRTNPACDICNAGDMIPLEERFMNARYRPSTPPLTEAQRQASLRAKKRNLRWDHFEQRLALLWYRAKLTA